MSTSSRLPDWEERLVAFVAGARDKPHIYGTNDCLIGLAAGVAKAVTGKDFARGHRGKYKSQASAVRYLRSIGHDSPESFLDALFVEKPIGFAQRGDLVLVPGNEGEWPVPAVCMGDAAFAIGVSDHDGLHPVPRAQWLKAWAIGDHHSGAL